MAEWGSGGGGSSSSTRKKSKPRKQNPKRDVIRALARINTIKNPEKRAQAQAVIGRALEGLDGNEITALGRKADLTPADVQAITTAAGETHLRRTGGDEIPLLNPALDILDRATARPVKRALVEGRGGADPLGALRGIYEGSIEGKQAPGAQAIIALASRKSPEETAKIREGLPAPVRVAGDFAGDVAFDWSNYLTLGAGALADNAARSVAKGLAAKAGEEAGEAALSPAARAIYERILTKGSKALTKAERDELPGHIVRKLNRARGGVRIAGKPIPGSPALNRKLNRLGVKPGGVGSGTEAAFRPRAALRQGERSGDLARGVTQDVENIQAQVRGAAFQGGLSTKRAEAGVFEALGRAAGKSADSKAAIRAGKAIIKRDPEVLDRIRNALDVGGGRAAVDALPAGEREAATFLRNLADEDYAELTRVGALDPEMESIDPAEYLYHAADQTTREEGRRGITFRGGESVPGRADQGFLRARTNREAIAGVKGYEQNPIVSMGLHQKGTARQVSNVEAWTELRRLSPENPLVISEGDPIPMSTNNYDEVKVPVLREAGDPRTETVLVHKSVAPFFTKILKSQTDNTLKRNIEYLNALWARWATGTSGFISRNVLQGNLYMGMVLAEARNPRIWAKSLGSMRRMQRGIARFGDPYKFLKADEVELIEGAIKNNAVESNFLEAISEQSEEALQGLGKMSKAVKGSKASPLSTNFLPIERISAANQWAEGWSRLSVYANKIAQGYAPPEAAAIARRFLLDYKDLAPVNEAGRLINPFLTWTYKSAPLILGTLAKDPRKVKIPLALLNAVNAEGASSEGIGVTPQWMTEAGAVTLPKALREKLPLGLNQSPQVFTPGTPIHTTLDALAPVISAIQAARGRPGALGKAGGDLVNLIGLGGVPGGAFKAAMEAQAEKQFFSGRRFQPGQRVPTPLPLRPIFGETMPWEAWNAANSLLPGLSRVATVAPQSDYEKDIQGRRALSQLGGVSLYPNDAAARRSEWYRRLDELNAWIRSQRDKGMKITSKTPTKKTRTSSGSSANWGG